MNEQFNFQHTQFKIEGKYMSNEKNARLSCVSKYIGIIADYYYYHYSYWVRLFTISLVLFSMLYKFTSFYEQKITYNNRYPYQ